MERVVIAQRSDKPAHQHLASPNACVNRNNSEYALPKQETKYEKDREAGYRVRHKTEPAQPSLYLRPEQSEERIERNQKCLHKVLKSAGSQRALAAGHCFLVIRQ